MWSFKKLFRRKPKQLSELAKNRVIELLDLEAQIEEGSHSLLYSAINVRDMVSSLPLPRALLVDIFFEALPRCDVLLLEEGVVSTGRCKQCPNLRYRQFSQRSTVDVSDLFCAMCCGDLFIQCGFFY